MPKKFDMIQRTMGVLRFPGHVYISFLNFYTTNKNILGSKRERIRTFSFGSASAAKLDVLIKKKVLLFLSGYVIAIDGEKVISRANCAVFERLAFNLTSLIV